MDDFNKQLIDSFDEAREYAKVLADKIKDSLPFFTKHDITHIDKLWNMTDILLWDINEDDDPADKILNPAEAYVLGLSFLLHDLSMGFVAYKNGISDLKGNPVFLDDLAWAFQNETGRYCSDNDEQWSHISIRVSYR